MQELPSFSDDELKASIAENCLKVSDTERKKFKSVSFNFLCTLPWCEDAEIDPEKLLLAQALLIHAMSEDGNGFDPMATRGSPQLRRRNIGRTAVEREFFEQSSEFSGSDPISLLRTQSIPYGLLINWLCPELHDRSNVTEATADCGIAVYVV